VRTGEPRRLGGGASSRSVTVGGTRLHVQETGEGRPLLLINGIGAHVGRRESVAVTRPMLDAALPAVMPHPVSLMSAGIRAFWT
jgi:hypothetical protein